MKLLLEINSKDAGLGERESFTRDYNLRKASRAVVFNDSNQIAILFVSKDNYHKLPGGGFEADEDTTTALQREVLEEAGVEIAILDEIGLTIEYRDHHNLLQLSYCYLAKTVGKLSEPQFDHGELADGFQLMWIDLDEAIALLTKDDTTDKNGKFIKIRDLAILKEAKKIIELQ
jgi:8-oxo-dGTP pyrophosphatase MutT (NUDIX family)